MAEQTRPLPGSTPDPPEDMRHYLVLFHDDVEQGPKTRSALVASHSAGTASLVARMLGDVRAAGREHEIAEVGAPTSFGAVAIFCTETLAAWLRQLAYVEAVVAD